MTDPASLILDEQIRAYRSLRLGPTFLRTMDSFSAEFTALARAAAPWVTAGSDVTLVVPHPLARMDRLITRLSLLDGRKPGVFDRNFEDPDRYHAVDESVPTRTPYLVVGFEPGEEFRNEPPEVAVASIRERGRFPLTISEGLAVFLHHPATLRSNHCWSLAGSTRGDRRVPALWISAGAPKLGWCFAGAPHTWLGTASAAQRVLTP